MYRCCNIISSEFPCQHKTRSIQYYITECLGWEPFDFQVSNICIKIDTHLYKKNLCAKLWFTIVSVLTTRWLPSRGNWLGIYSRDSYSRAVAYLLGRGGFIWGIDFLPGIFFFWHQVYKQCSCYFLTYRLYNL